MIKKFLKDTPGVLVFALVPAMIVFFWGYTITTKDLLVAFVNESTQEILTQSGVSEECQKSICSTPYKIPKNVVDQYLLFSEKKIRNSFWCIDGDDEVYKVVGGDGSTADSYYFDKNGNTIGIRLATKVTLPHAQLPLIDLGGYICTNISDQIYEKDIADNSEPSYEWEFFTKKSDDISLSRVDLLGNCSRPLPQGIYSSSVDQRGKTATIYWWSDALQKRLQRTLSYESKTGFVACSNSAKKLMWHLKRGEIIIHILKKTPFDYIEIINGCDHNFKGPCVNVRSGPGEEYSVVANLRTSVSLKIDGVIKNNSGTWYKVTFDDEWLRYPERLKNSWYVSTEFAQGLTDEWVRLLNVGTGISNNKHIIINRTDQTLSAFNGNKLFMVVPVSTGREITPTPLGVFSIFRKMPSRYMQGPIPGLTKQSYDLPGVPWNLYFTAEGDVIHGTYWHKKFGQPYSNGCVNMTPDQAKKLYEWAEVGTRVLVRD